MNRTQKSKLPGKNLTNRKNVLLGKRILICGKGGSGKSSIITLMGKVLAKKGFKVVMLDGDASNPGGLVSLLFGVKNGPAPLIEFFGGRERVGCPIDNPDPLTRFNDDIPLIQKHIRIEEIPKKYVMQQDNLLLLQGGKISNAYEGCDGPISKITRDLIVGDEYITLIDVEAGIEHFGRGIEKNIDIIIVIVDPTYESFLVADKVTKLSQQMSIINTWAVLNRIRYGKMRDEMTKEIEKRHIKILGCVGYDQKVEYAGFLGDKLESCEAFNEVIELIENLINNVI